MKRTLATILALVMVLSCMGAVFASADDPSYMEGDFRYEIVDGNAIITGYFGKGGDVVIPDTLGGAPVTQLGKLFASDDEWVFYNRTDLTSVKLPEGLRSINTGVFAGCTGLTSIDFPKSLTGFGITAFYNCTGLTSLVFPESAFISISAFSGCTGLTSVKFGKGETSITEYAFANCTGLTEIVLPINVTTVYFNAFSGCTNLKDIYCEAPEKPESWENGWSDECPATVHWGYKISAPIPGDIFGDGKLNGADYMLLKRAVLGTYILTEEQKALADINKDGKINGADYMLLKRAVIGSYIIK